MRRTRYSRDTGVLKTVKVLGNKIDIRVDDDGQFGASVGADHLHDFTLAGLMKQLQKSAKKTQIEVAIPATLLGEQLYTSGSHFVRKYLGTGAYDVVVYALDEDTFEVKFRGKDNNGDPITHRNKRHDSKLMKPMTATDVKEWNRFRKEKEQAASAFDKFEDRFEFKDLRERVKDALAEAVDDPKETSEDDSEDPR